MSLLLALPINRPHDYTTSNFIRVESHTANCDDGDWFGIVGEECAATGRASQHVRRGENAAERIRGGEQADSKLGSGRGGIEVYGILQRRQVARGKIFP